MTHPAPDASNPNRRKLLIGAGVGAVVVLTPAAIWTALRAGERGAFSQAQRDLLARLADLLLPTTDTPGAAAAGVSGFVELAITHGAGGLSPNVMDKIETELAAHAPAPFLTLGADLQLAALIALDVAAFAPDAATGDAWRAVKGLIVTGYYTSEIGGSEELQYELVPGRYDPNAPMDQTTRAFSSDWTAVDFG